ncbi:MAG: TonB-dependent receptor [Opitutus sp.]|nr:TonB-dependent receptor [Opitutus sp.]
MKTTPRLSPHLRVVALFSLVIAWLAPVTAQTAPAAAPAGRAGAPVTLEPVEVTGSRIRSVLGEATVQPVFTYTREELDILGVQQMTDLNNFIPQLPTVAWESTPETGYVNLANNGGRTNFNGGLRNLGNTATLLLIDGRRAPKLGTATGSDSYDLSGIPMAAIERIDVLTDGASAIYGADAAAGVINVILKKNYRGTQLNVSYGNTFKSDTGSTTVQLSSAYRTGPLALDVSASWSKTNAFSPRDRAFSASNDRRPYGGGDGRGTVPGGRGVIRNQVLTANLPGLNSPTAAIPAGSNGVNVTIADYANSGPIPDFFDGPQYQVYGDKGLKSLRLGSSYEIKPWLTPFIEANRSEQTSFRPGLPRTVAVNLPAGYPGNPFGIPVSVRRVYWEMTPYEDTHLSTITNTWQIGVRGRLPKDWRYEAAVQLQKSTYSVTGAGSGGVFQGTTPLNAAVVAGRQPILLNDGLTNSPNSPDVMRSFLIDGNYSERPTLWTYDFKADGAIWKLPAGEAKAAVGLEEQEEYAKFSVVPNDIFGRLKSAASRKSFGMFAEVQVPLASEKKNFPLVNKFSLNVSARRDDYNDFGAKTAPRYGVLWHPFKALALRWSYGEGYKVPNLSSIYGPRTVGNVGIGSAANVFDPKRGGENVFVNVTPGGTSYTVSQISGGNRDLRPESSVTKNMGALLDVPFIKGLSIGADYYDIRQTDRIGGGLVIIVANFEERITRAPTTPADTAKGWPGLITAVDVRSINLASYRATGWDYQLRYFRKFDRVGMFNLRFIASKPKIGEQRGAPNAPIATNIPGTYWRGTGTVVWSKGPVSLGTTANYTSAYLGRYFPGGSYFNSRVQNNAFTIWDVNASYDFARDKWNPTGKWRYLFDDLRLTANVYNAKNQEPQMVSGSATGTVDPRGRRYQVALAKKF